MPKDPLIPSRTPGEETLRRHLYDVIASSGYAFKISRNHFVSLSIDALSKYVFFTARQHTTGYCVERCTNCRKNV